MTTLYRRRHTGGAHRTPSVRGGRTGRRSHLFPPALRRLLSSLAAVVAVAGATAGGFASAAKPHTSTASFTAGPAAAAQTIELADNRIDANADLAEGRRAGVQRAIASAQRLKAAAVARSRARAAVVAQAHARADAAAAFARDREVAAERSARETTRQSLLARAQSDPKSVARLLAADRGWEGEQFDCLSSLWAKESEWRWDANNPSSDAYGIPQALPGSKMASFGSDWETNPVTQIKWGLEYISTSYGTPCSAWAKSQASNWY